MSGPYKAALRETVVYMEAATILYLRPDGWWFAACGEVETRMAPRALWGFADEARASRRGSEDAGASSAI